MLIADTSASVGHAARRGLPFVFAASSMASAGASAAILVPVEEATPVRHLHVGGSLPKPVPTSFVKRRLGPILAEQPYEGGRRAVMIRP